MKKIKIGNRIYEIFEGEMGENKHRLKIYNLKDKLLKYYYFGDEEKRNVYIKNLYKQEEVKEEKQKERKIWRKNEAMKNKEKYEVGDLFYYFRGYEQTNIEFFQITEKKGAKVFIKEIQGEVITHTSWGSERVKPIKDNFIKSDIEGWKIIGAYGINMKFGHLQKINEEDMKHGLHQSHRA